MTREASDDPAAVIDLRGRLRPVGDQGRRGTCVAFALTALHETDRGPDREAAIPEDLAEEVVFWGAKQIDGNRNDGTRFTSANQALQRWGQPAEALWPYDDSRKVSDAGYTPPSRAVAVENCHRAALRPIPIDAAAVRAELWAGRPVAVGVPVWDRFRSPDSEPLPAPERSELYPTGHAVVIVGDDPGRGAVLIRNSWGPAWGDAGHWWVESGLLGMVTAAWAIEHSDLAAGRPIEHYDEVLT